MSRIVYSVLGFCVIFFFVPLFEAARFRCDYTYYPDVQGWFKLHEELSNWTRAKQICLNEGGVLAAPTSIEIQKIMQTLIPNNPVSAVHTDIITISMEDSDNSTFEYVTEEYVWILKSDGTFEKISKESWFPFICHKKAEEVKEPNECGTMDDEYTLDNRTGHCYKFHSIRNIWRLARFVCAAEGGHLAVINSDVEAQVITDVFARNPNDSIPGNSWKDSAFLGFHMLQRNTWITVNGDTLSEAGYDKWSPGEPNNAKGDEFCGSVGRNGLLFDDPCYRALPFICEKNTDSLLLCEEDQRIVNNITPLI